MVVEHAWMECIYSFVFSMFLTTYDSGMELLGDDVGRMQATTSSEVMESQLMKRDDKSPGEKAGSADLEA